MTASTLRTNAWLVASHWSRLSGTGTKCSPSSKFVLTTIYLISPESVFTIRSSIVALKFFVLVLVLGVEVARPVLAPAAGVDVAKPAPVLGVEVAKPVPAPALGVDVARPVLGVDVAKPVPVPVLGVEVAKPVPPALGVDVLKLRLGTPTVSLAPSTLDAN